MTPATLEELAATGVVAVLRAPSADAAVAAVDAIVRGGVTGVEITFSTPDAPDAIRRVAERYGDAVCLGAGTVLTPEQARDAVEAGARFLVSPGSDPATAPSLVATGAAVLLGALTPTEVLAALRLGTAAVKVFPASLGGPAHLRSLRGPFPDVPFVPTGGVDPGNLGEWFRAGALAVGAGSELCPPAALAAGDLDVVEESARRFAAALAAVPAGLRRGPVP